MQSRIGTHKSFLNSSILPQLCGMSCKGGTASEKGGLTTTKLVYRKCAKNAQTFTALENSSLFSLQKGVLASQVLTSLLTTSWTHLVSYGERLVSILLPTLLCAKS